MWSTIKKFGLGYYDLPTMLWNVAVLLRAMTLQIDSRNKKPISLFFYVLSAVIALSYFYVYLVSMLWFVFVYNPEHGDVLAGLIVFSLGVSSEIGTVKLLYIIVHIDKVKQIVEETLAVNATVIPGSRFSNNLMVTLREVKKRAMVFWLVIVGNGVVYIIKPILMPGRHMMEDKFILFGLQPMYETPNYYICFMLFMAGVTFTCYLPATISAFLIVIIGYVEGQMLALTEELLHLWEDALAHYNNMQPAITDSDEVGTVTEQNNREEIINKYIEEHLKDIIKTHGRNIVLLQKVDQVFSNAIAFEFLLLGIGLIVELLGGLENTFIEIPFALMQVGMDCFTGQRVMDASMKFERAVYECNWEKFNLSNMKIIRILLLSSQKTMSLTAGGIIKPSFSCYMQVNRSIYSAYTTLRSTM